MTGRHSYEEDEPDPTFEDDFPEMLNDHRPPPDPVQPLIVVGSHDWDNWGAVGDAIRGVSMAHSNLAIITSGCPTGAEWFAREYAAGQGWTTHAMRDEDQLNVEHALVLGFVRNGSNVAQTHLARLRTRFWTRIIQDDTWPQLSGWEAR